MYFKLIPIDFTSLPISQIIRALNPVSPIDTNLVMSSRDEMEKRSDKIDQRTSPDFDTVKSEEYANLTSFHVMES